LECNCRAAPGRQGQLIKLRRESLGVLPLFSKTYNSNVSFTTAAMPDEMPIQEFAPASAGKLACMGV
jgi:hypothetical protein